MAKTLARRDNPMFPHTLAFEHVAETPQALPRRHTRAGESNRLIPLVTPRFRKGFARTQSKNVNGIIGVCGKLDKLAFGRMPLRELGLR
jgi:hypothetical protein